MYYNKFIRDKLKEIEKLFSSELDEIFSYNIENILNDVYREGFKEGEIEGKEKSYDKGYDDGYDRGLDDAEWEAE